MAYISGYMHVHMYIWSCFLSLNCERGHDGNTTTSLYLGFVALAAIYSSPESWLETGKSTEVPYCICSILIIPLCGYLILVVNFV